MSKRFRAPEDTDEALLKMEAKKRRSAKKELKGQKAQAQSINMKYFIDEVQPSQSSKSSTLVLNDSDIDSDENENIERVWSLPASLLEK